MDKRGEGKVLVGSLIIIAVALIIGVNLFTSSAQNLEVVRNTYNVNNGTTITSTGASKAITGCQNISNLVVYNSTNNSIVPSTNYTINGYYISNGALITNITTTFATEYKPNAAYISYTCEPFGYDTSSGGRAVAGLIIILFALAIAVVSMYPTLKDWINLGGR